MYKLNISTGLGRQETLPFTGCLLLFPLFCIPLVGMQKMPGNRAQTKPM